MKYLKNFGLFWYDFIIGDDWTVAVAVVAGLVVTGLLAHAGVWWLMPVVVAAVLAASLWRATQAK